MRVLVVGGGIAGLATAAALTQRGVTVDVVERNRTWRTAGAGITLYPNGERALRVLGIDQDVVDAGCRVEVIRMVSASGAVVAETPAERWDGVGGVVAIHREALQAVLVRAASGARLRLGTTLTGIEDDGRSVVVTFTDGSTGSYDVVIGADGIRSSVRRTVFGDSATRITDQMYWRASVDARVVDVATMVFDTDRYVALMPLGDGQTYIALQTRTVPLGVERDERITSMRAGCEALGGPVPAALDAIRSDEEVHVGPAEEVAEIAWRRSRVVLAGDASHALSPVLTQGGSLAIEDAVVLAEELATRDDVDDGLDAYVRRREPRVRLVQERTAQRIAHLNAGASQVDLAAEARETSAILSQPI